MFALRRSVLSRRLGLSLIALMLAAAVPVRAQQSAGERRPTAPAGEAAPNDAVSSRWPQDNGIGRAPAVPQAPTPRPAGQNAERSVATHSAQQQRKWRGKSARASRRHAAKVKRSVKRAAIAQRARKPTRQVRAANRSAGVHRPLALTPPILRRAKRRS